MNLTTRKSQARKGSLSGMALGVITALVAMFIGLYMIVKVSVITAIENTSDFYTTYTSLASNTGTVFDVLILVVIVVALGVAIGVLKGFSGEGRSTSAI